MFSNSSFLFSTLVDFLSPSVFLPTADDVGGSTSRHNFQLVGTAVKIIEAQKQELAKRQAILSEILSGFDLHSYPTSTHAWLRLPEPWRGAGFARTCLQRGVSVLPGDAFAVGREPVQHGVRINIGAARSQEDLRRALKIMRELLDAGHLQIPGFV
ncbi:hypothetical protein AB4Z52_26975 [Rhizobium sp. 2YAF20]|uniref:hypothetical protein n=1 Tax=Rhizobium sp. 2YAF20 TaxID=3233027 RepID=UPI003F982B6F